MSRQCIRCGRKIDVRARICPYCNWDQTQPVPAHQPVNCIELLIAAVQSRGFKSATEGVLPLAAPLPVDL